MFLLKLLSRLPLPVLYLFAPLVYFVTYHLLGHRRHVLFDNLRQCFPRRSEAEIVALAKRNFRNFSDVLIEMLKSISMRDAEVLRRVDLQNIEPLLEHARLKQPMVILTAHQCNWEWLLLAACLRLPFPLDVVYKPLEHDPFDDIMRQARGRFGGTLIAPENFVATILQRRGQAVGLVMNADQTPLKEEEKLWTKFLGRDTAFFIGADKIARMTRAPVYFVAMRRRARGYYEAHISELARPPFPVGGYPIVERYVLALEGLVLESPEDWLWVYNKWKYGKPLYG